MKVEDKLYCYKNDGLGHRFTVGKYYEVHSVFIFDDDIDCINVIDNEDDIVYFSLVAWDHDMFECSDNIFKYFHTLVKLRKLKLERLNKL